MKLLNIYGKKWVEGKEASFTLSSIQQIRKIWNIMFPVPVTVDVK